MRSHGDEIGANLVRRLENLVINRPVHDMRTYRNCLGNVVARKGLQTGPRILETCLRVILGKVLNDDGTIEGGKNGQEFEPLLSTPPGRAPKTNA